MTSPTQRSLTHCKSHGWPYAIVEHWNSQAFLRVDLWGIGDLIVLDDEPGAVIVQVCAGSSHANRAEKVRRTLIGGTKGDESEATLARILRHSNALKRWTEKGNRIEVWSWAKHGPRGKRKLWELRKERILTYQGVPIPYIEDMEKV